MRALARFALLGAAISAIGSRAMGGARGVPLEPEFGAARGGNRKRYSEDHYRAADPFFGIASKGRTGAKRRSAKMVDGLASLGKGKGGRIASRPFLRSTARNSAFLAELEGGKSHNQALKLARRVSRAASAKAATDGGRIVPVHASGPGRPIPTARSGGGN